MYKIHLMVILLIALGGYIVIPSKGEVSMPLFYGCFGVMLLSNYIYFKAKKKENYLDFDSLDNHNLFFTLRSSFLIHYLI